MDADNKVSSSRTAAGFAARWPLLAVLLVALPLQAPAAERGWRTLATPHYRILSQMPDRETINWAKEFDQFIVSMSGVLRIDPRQLPPLTVIMFDRERNFAPYRPVRPDGSTAKIGGLFVRHPTWSVIGMTYSASDEYQRQLVFHEATHWLMSADESRHPAWFAEGIAELLSTFEFRGGQINWARPLSDHLGTMDEFGPLPLREFLAEPRAIFDRDTHTDRFYAQSWAFTHFLLFSGDNARAEQLRRFLETFKTESGEATVDAVFGAQLAQVEKDFREYVQQSAWRYSSQPGREVAALPPLQDATPALVETSLGYLALGADRQELAQTHARKALQLDAADPGGYELLAYQARTAGQMEQAVAHSLAALERGSKDSHMYVLRAEGLRADPNAIRQVTDLYESAVNLSPRHLDLYKQLVYAVISLRETTAEDARILRQGTNLFPGEDWLRVGAAAIDQGLDRGAAALEALEVALRPGSTLDEQQRGIAGSLRTQWHMMALDTEVVAALRANDLPAARASLERHRPFAAGSEAATQHVQRTEETITGNELMEKLDNAQRARNSQEARAIATQILALPNVPPELRDALQELVNEGR